MCRAGLGERLATLCDCLKGFSEDWEVQAIKGQLLFAAALSYEPFEEEPVLMHWVPSIVRGNNLRAINLWVMGLAPEKRQISPQAKDLLVDAAGNLEKAFRRTSTLPILYRQILAFCHYATGHFYDAAKEYQSLLKADEQHPVRGSEFLRLLYDSAAAAHELAGDHARASETLNELLGRFPETPGIYMRMAEIASKQGRHDDVPELLRKELDQHPELDQDWRVSAILAIGGLTRSSVEQLIAELDKLDRSIDPRGELDLLIKSMLLEYWPLFAKLSPASQDRWIKGMKLLHGQGVLKAMHAEGARNLALAVEHELSSGLFSPFKTELRKTSPSVTVHEQISPWQRDFSLFLERDRWNLGLGAMFDSLRAAHRGRPEALREFGEWISRRYPTILTVLTAIKTELIVGVRNRESHASLVPVSREEALEAAKLCQLVLESLLR